MVVTHCIYLKERKSKKTLGAETSGRYVKAGVAKSWYVQYFYGMKYWIMTEKYNIHLSSREIKLHMKISGIFVYIIYTGCMKSGNNQSKGYL